MDYVIECNSNETPISDVTDDSVSILEGFEDVVRLYTGSESDEHQRT